MPKIYEEMNRYKSIIFWIFAVLPFCIADIVLRYKLNPVIINQIKYKAVPLLFSVFWILLLVYLAWAIMPKKVGKIFYLLLSLLFGFWCLANYFSFKVLSRFLWIEDVFLASEASGYFNTALTYINVKIILICIIYSFSTILAYMLWEKPEFSNKCIKHVPIAVCLLGLAGVQFFMTVNIKKDKEAGAWEVWEKPTLVYDKFSDSGKALNVAGLYQYTFKNLYRMIAKSNKVLSDEQEIDDYFDNKILSDNEMTGILKNKNVIFVLMESMDDWLISDKYTPTIKYMMDNGINFANHYMPNVGIGYTFNAEFASNTGYYCPSTESSASIYTKNYFPFALGNVLKNAGYVCKSFHFNTKDFYNREAMHRSFGYEQYVSFMKYLSIEKCVQDSESVKNDELYGMMTSSEKFLDFIITYSAHLPYNTEDNKLKGAKNNYPELIDNDLDKELNNLYLLAHDTDEFFRILLERLDNDDLLKDTVIIAFSDHYAYGFQDTDKLKEFSKDAGSEILEKVPFFIYSPGIKHIQVDKVTSTINILPTITNMLGIEKNKYYLGQDAFDEDYTQIVYFPNGNWYDGNIFFDSQKPDEYISEIEYIEEMNKYIKKLREVNDYVITSNYFSRK